MTDEKDITHVIKRGLERKGIVVDAFNDPKEALEHYSKNSKIYYMVLSDVRIPGISGLQVARKVKQLNPEVKVVLLTAFEIDKSEFTKVLPSTHVDDFIKKPVHLDTLFNIILNYIGSAKRLNKNRGEMS